MVFIVMSTVGLKTTPWRDRFSRRERILSIESFNFIYIPLTIHTLFLGYILPRRSGRSAVHRARELRGGV